MKRKTDWENMMDNGSVGLSTRVQPVLRLECILRIVIPLRGDRRSPVEPLLLAMAAPRAIGAAFMSTGPPSAPTYYQVFGAD